jgi:hypothetical protein
MNYGCGKVLTETFRSLNKFFLFGEQQQTAKQLQICTSTCKIMKKKTHKQPAQSN